MSETLSPIQLFYSYSRKDASFCEELEIHLAGLKRQGLINGWHDREINPGDDWARQIDDHLATSAIILLLVSPDFLASDYCYELEMKHALKMHETGQAIVIPIIIRPVNWSYAPFAKLQALPTAGKPVSIWANRDEAWLDVVQGIHRSCTLIRSRAGKGEHSTRAPAQVRPQKPPLTASEPPNKTTASKKAVEAAAVNNEGTPRSREKVEEKAAVNNESTRRFREKVRKVVTIGPFIALICAVIAGMPGAIIGSVAGGRELAISWGISMALVGCFAGFIICIWTVFEE